MKPRALVIWLVVTVAAGVWLPGLRAQEPAGDKGTSVSAVERKNRAPVNKEILRVQLPEPKEIKLANGLAVLVLERHELPTVNLVLWVETGALADPKDLPGLATFTAEMLREGTTRRSSAQLAAEVDDTGATLSSSADFGSSVSTVAASGLVDSLGKIIDLMSDVVLNPTFPPEELEKYKKRQLAELEQERSEPDFLSRGRFFQVLYRDFPAAVISPTPESVKQVTTDQLKRFHEQYYVPNNALLGVAGDVTPEQLQPLLEKYIGGWKNRPVTQPNLSVLPPPAAKKIYLVNRPTSVQANIVAGDYAVRRADPDYIPLFVMNRILGGGATGRLFLNLREAKGYTYGAYSYFTADIYRGPWMASTEVRNAVTDGAMHELMAELQRIRSEPVPENELDDARRAIVANFALSLEQPATLLRYAMTVKYYGLPEDYYNRFPEEVAKVTPAVVQRVAQKYVDLDHLQVVCVGDGSQIKTALEKYGPVEVYDTEGKPVVEKATATGKSGR
ncbi:MAG: insulinase family protein [Acidobacteriia bacterium]|nr:insulinase family protein [Terriglobia bacterium]